MYIYQYQASLSIDFFFSSLIFRMISIGLLSRALLQMTMMVDFGVMIQEVDHHKLDDLLGFFGHEWIG